MKTTEAPLFDVVAISIDDSTVRLIAESKTLRNAEAIVSMAVMRRGVDEEFFAEVPAGTYKNSDKWRGK